MLKYIAKTKGGHVFTFRDVEAFTLPSDTHRLSIKAGGNSYIIGGVLELKAEFDSDPWAQHMTWDKPPEGGAPVVLTSVPDCEKTLEEPEYHYEFPRESGVPKELISTVSTFCDLEALKPPKGYAGRCDSVVSQTYRAIKEAKLRGIHVQ